MQRLNKRTNQIRQEKKEKETRIQTRREKKDMKSKILREGKEGER